MLVKDPFHATLSSGTTAPSPRITAYLPDKPGFGGTALVIFPGGGYRHRAEHEGHGYAKFFANDGIASFVVDYRIKPEGGKHPAMLEDAYAAIETIRQRASEFAIDPHKLGVVGSSAGGHLAAHALVSWRDYPSVVSLRPDFGILCYPVIYMNGQFCHKGSLTNLLGEHPSEGDFASVNVIERVDKETPRCFLWHTLGDGSVPPENSIGFATALRMHQVPFELHIYQRDGHGHGLSASMGWNTDCLRWLRDYADGRQDK